MRLSTRLGVVTALVLGISGVSGTIAPSTEAVQLNGQTHFTHAPLLNDATTTENSTLVSTATHYFTLSVPEDAGEPLGQVVIAQKDGDSSSRLIRYSPEDTSAFTGTPGERGEALPIQTSFDRDNQTVTVTFDQPVAPGTLVTIRLEPRRNPRLGGVYLFGVTAYPAGASPYGQFLGYGRLQFYERSDFEFPLGF